MPRLNEFMDLTGHRSGRLTVLSHAGRRQCGTKMIHFWHVQCDCGATRDISAVHLQSGASRSCGCIRKERLRDRHPPLEDRFWAKVNRDGPIVDIQLGPCWVWTASLNEDGYGGFNDAKQRIYLAHAVSFFLAHGRKAVPMCLHKCDNRACVNPAHLYEGTQIDNMRDRSERGRTYRPGRPTYSETTAAVHVSSMAEGTDT